MKNPINTTGAWIIPQPSTEFTVKHQPAEVDRWRKLLGSVIELSKLNGWSKAEVRRRTGMAEATFSQWTNGNYAGVLSNLNDQISTWLDNLEESSRIAATLPVSPRYLKTPTGEDVIKTLLFAQISAGMVMVTLPSGSGKTTAAKHFRDYRPHVFMVTASPHTKTIHGILVDIAEELQVTEHNPTRLVRTIGRKLQRIGEGSLLIVDEAQNLVPDAINQLRHFVDINNCGLALLGNEDTGTSFFTDRSKSVMSRAQVATRFDRRLKRENNPQLGAEMLISAWGVDDEDCVKFLKVIAQKPGALRNIDRTIKAALISGLSGGEDLTLPLLRDAWKNRDLGDIA